MKDFVLKVLKWLAGFFQDQGDRTSSKRLVLFAMALGKLMMIYVACKGYITTLTAKEIFQSVDWTVTLTIWLALGLITSEFLTKFWPGSTSSHPNG